MWLLYLFFFFKQKTAYEMRISDWSSDVCSSDLPVREFTGWLDTDAISAALAAQSIVLVDARAADRFAGRNETMDPVAGHVPGAVNHPLARNLDADGHFLPADELRRRWQMRLGGHAPAQLVSMCGRSEEHPSALQSLMSNSYAVFCL